MIAVTDFVSWPKICSRTYCHSAMRNNLNTLEMKRVLELQPFIPNANRLNIWQLNNLSQRLKGILSKYKHFSQTNTQMRVELWESNVINVLRGGGGSWGLCPPGAEAFLLVTDNRRSHLDSLFCVITQHRKYEFGHHRHSKKISNAQELIMQLSQTLSCAIAKIKVSNSAITNHTKKILPQRPPPFFNFCIT